MNLRIFFLHLVLLLAQEDTMGQYSWDVKDPINFDIIDLGDNKVLLYNGIGIGVSLLLDKEGKGENLLPHRGFTIRYCKEYKRNPLGYITKFSFRHRYALRDYLFIGGEYSLIHANDGSSSALGLGGTFVFEWHIIRQPAFRMIYDNGVGPNVFFHPFPEGGTRFSFSTYYGLKTEFKVASRWFSAGLFNLHISNAGIKGQERNPAFDGLGFNFGILF